MALVFSTLTMTAAFGGTLRVERDGSGDYIEIQDAVNAAASGDTLLIGVGRWDAMQTYSPGATFEVIVAIRGKDLTLIGSGQSETVIGPAIPPPFSIPGPVAVWVDADHDLIIQNLTITNMRDGLLFYGNELMAEGIVFLACEIGSSAWGMGYNTYRDCVFSECIDTGLSGLPRMTNLLVEDCIFDATYWIHISLQNIENIMIDGCEFRRALLAIQFDGGSCVGTVQNCLITATRSTCIYTTGGSRMNLTNTELSGGGVQLAVVNYAHVAGSGNIFHGTDGEWENYCTILGGLGTLDLQNNHILRGYAPYAVRFHEYPFDFVEQHLEDNYWGTTSADSVAAWIWDEHDDRTLNIHTFTEPFHGQPVGSESLSFGELKRLFR